MTTSTPSTSKASRPKPHPDWMMVSGWRLASVPEWPGLETTANVMSADSPITRKAVTASVIGVERSVRILVHSERTVSENSGRRPVTGAERRAGYAGAGAAIVWVTGVAPAAGERGTRRRHASAP